ncbi:hypothetical protein OYC64_007463 [Pagothenia borchgrevinki]|uniref:LRAT domain-containing protein n=1 Tax=Pagothenia borchgrevinki TaxID=8213 RepID=A0ABD2GU80_PAGBO
MRKELEGKRAECKAATVINSQHQPADLLTAEFCFQSRFGSDVASDIKPSLHLKVLQVTYENKAVEIMAEYDKNPEIGDLIEIFKGPYQHWAVYVGDGFIAHSAPASEVAGDSASSMKAVPHEKALVKKDKLRVVVGTNKWKINNILDEEYEPRPAHIIVRNACALVGKEVPYCVLRKNCEHFATELRYRKAESRQVRKAEVVVQGVFLSIGFMGLFLALARLLTALFGSRKENKNEQ